MVNNAKKISVVKLFKTSLIHFIITFIYFFLIVNIDTLLNSISFIFAIFLIISIIASLISYAYLSNSGVGNYLLSIPIYILVMIVGVLILVLFRIPFIISDNLANGFIFIYMFGYSIITFAIGNLLGLLIKKYVIKEK